MEVVIKKLETKDVDEFVQLIRLFAEVFEMSNFSMPAREHLLKLLTKSDFMAFAAIEENKIVGGLTSYTLDQYYSEKPLAYIYDLAIKKSFQRQGIGSKLIAAITEYCSLHGFEEVFVQADQVDDYAIEFYRSTPITNEEQVIHFSYALPANH